MSKLIYAEPAACPTGAFGIVEDEIARPNVAVDEVMRLAAQRAIELFGVGLARALQDLNLQEPVADEQRRGDRRLDGLLTLATDRQPIDDGIHVPHLRLVADHDLRRDVDALTIDDQ